MKKNEFTLREKKYGNKRLEIVLTFLKELEERKIQSISVEEICEKVNISKVTFFKYFNSKEEVLYYFIHRWQYQLSDEIENNLYFGLEGILHVFESVAKEYYGLNFMLAIVQYFIKLDAPPEPLVITDYEYYLFNESAYEKNCKRLNLDDIFNHYIQQLSLKNKTIRLEELISLFYGVPVTAHITGKRKELYQLYQECLVDSINKKM